MNNVHYSSNVGDALCSEVSANNFTCTSTSKLMTEANSTFPKWNSVNARASPLKMKSSLNFMNRKSPYNRILLVKESLIKEKPVEQKPFGGKKYNINN